MSRSCTGCGGEPGEGRYCTHCGRAVDTWPGAAPASSPPPVVSTPATPRFPLYADQPLGGPPGPPPPEPPRSAAAYVAAPTPAPPSPPPGAPRHSTRRPPWLLWVAVAAALVLVAGLGAVLALGPGTDDAEQARAATGSPADPEASEPDGTAPAEASGDETVATGERRDVARDAAADVPRTAPPSTDLQGNLTRYTADNLLDGVETTCWRMPGDGTGSEIVLTLAEPTAISAVGLVNGYAKTVGSGRGAVDWYAGNRRVQVVEWRFDDGTTVRQDLARNRSLQAIEIGPVTTSTVTLTLVEVSAPGKGRARRDFTAISDVALVGVPA